MALRLLHCSDTENAVDDPERAGRLVGTVRRGRDDRTLVCGTGDVLGPSLLGAETDGAAVWLLLGALAPDVSTVGNHDFDFGVKPLRTAVQRGDGDWLAANLRLDGVGADWSVEPATARTVGSTTAGFVGVTDPETVGDHPVVGGTTVTDPVAAVREAVAELDADRVVVLSHAGRTDDEIAALPGVDLVLGGHVHDVRDDRVARTPVVHPGQRGAYVAEVVVDGGLAVDLHDVSEGPLATEVTARYEELFAAEGLAEPVTELSRPVGRDRGDRYPESALGNAVTDAYRWATDADVAVVHPLTFRAGPPLTGEVTNGDLRACAPFDSELRTATLDGRALVALFESLVDPLPELDREVFGHVSGATLTWRRTATDLSLVDATVDGEAPAPGERYTVAAPAYEFESDLYPPLSAVQSDDIRGPHQKAAVTYAAERGLAPDGGRMRLTDDSVDGSCRSLTGDGLL